MNPIKRERSITPPAAGPSRSVRPRQASPVAQPAAPAIGHDRLSISFRGTVIERPRNRFPAKIVALAERSSDRYIDANVADFDLYEDVLRNNRVSPKLPPEAVARLQFLNKFARLGLTRELKLLLPLRQSAHAAKNMPSYQIRIAELADSLDQCCKHTQASRKRARVGLPVRLPHPEIAPEAGTTILETFINASPDRMAQMKKIYNDCLEKFNPDEIEFLRGLKYQMIWPVCEKHKKLDFLSAFLLDISTPSRFLTNFVDINLATARLDPTIKRRLQQIFTNTKPVESLKFMIIP